MKVVLYLSVHYHWFPYIVDILTWRAFFFVAVILDGDLLGSRLLHHNSFTVSFADFLGLSKWLSQMDAFFLFAYMLCVIMFYISYIQNWWLDLIFQYIRYHIVYMMRKWNGRLYFLHLSVLCYSISILYKFLEKTIYIVNGT